MEYVDCIIFQANSILSSDSCEVSRRKKEMVLWKNVTVSYNSNAHSMLCLMRGQPILTYVRHHFSTMSISKFSEEKWFPQDCLNHEIFGSFGLTKSTWIIVYGRGLRALKNIWDWQEPRPAVSPSSIVAYLRFFYTFGGMAWQRRRRHIQGKLLRLFSSATKRFFYKLFYYVVKWYGLLDDCWLASLHFYPQRFLAGCF